jgi:hypothetical protein
MCQHRHFCTVQDPIVCALVREKATSHNMHPNVLAQVDATGMGKKQNCPKKRLMCYRPDKNGSAMRSSSKRFNILMILKTAYLLSLFWQEQNLYFLVGTYSNST